MKTKKTTKIDLLIAVLSDHQWHWGNELAVEVSWRFGATIKDARNRGYQIETEQVGPKWRYRLPKS